MHLDARLTQRADVAARQHREAAHRIVQGSDGEAGSYTVGVQVRDAEGLTATATILLTATAPPQENRAPDARLQDAADQDVERVLPRIVPGPTTGAR